MIRGQDSSGVELLSSALALLRSVHGDSHPQVLDCRRSLAQRWWLEPERAEVEFLEILAAQRALFGGPHEHLIRTLSDLGVLWVTYGQLDKAVPILRETLAMQEELLGENHFRLAVTLSALASSMTRKGENLEAALPLFRRSLAITRENVEPDSINLAFPQMYLGYTLCRLDRPTEGERLLAEALRIFEKHRPRDDPHYLRARFYHGIALLLLHRLEEAELKLVEAFETRGDRWNKAYTSFAEWSGWLHRLYVEMGRPEEAERYADSG